MNQVSQEQKVNNSLLSKSRVIISLFIVFLISLFLSYGWSQGRIKAESLKDSLIYAQDNLIKIQSGELYRIEKELDRLKSFIDLLYYTTFITSSIVLVAIFAIAAVDLDLFFKKK